MPKRQVIVAYVPVLHAGYKRLFDDHPDATIYVLGPELIARFDQLRKELRALPPDEVVAAIKGWRREAVVLSPQQLETFSGDNAEIIMPDEDVCRQLAESDLAGKQVIFSPIFLRWDRRKMEAVSDPVSPDRVISTDKFDQEMIHQSAIEGLKSSNLYRRMGALIVKDKKVVLSAFNSSQPTPHSSWIDGDPRNNANRGTSIDLTTDIHAEARVIAEAAKQGIALAETQMYVLDFPCPTCAKLIANSGVAKLYFGRGYAVLDGEQVLRANKVELIKVEGTDTDAADPKTWVPYPEKPAKQ